MTSRTNYLDICAILSVAFLFLSCNSSGRSNVAEPETTQQANVSALVEVPAVLNICELIDSPNSYQDKTIVLKTSMYRVGASGYTFGDKACESRHPLFDLDFSSDFQASVCGSNDENSRMVCDFYGRQYEGETKLDWILDADFRGRFESYKSTEGFTSNGMRFRFVIQRVNNIQSVEPMGIIRLH